MTFTQLRDVFDYVKGVHYEAAQCCAAAAELPEDRQSLLADYFRQREEALGKQLATSQTQEGSEELDTWIQNIPNHAVDQALASLRQVSKHDTSELVKRALELQEEIVKMLRELAASLNVPKVSELLSAWAEQEKTTANQLGLAKLMQQDL